MSEVMDRVALELLAELRAVRAGIVELAAVDSGAFIAVPRRLNLGRQGRQYETWAADSSESFHAVKIDNPTASTVEVRFDGSQPTTGDADERVPAHAGRILTRPFDACSIGFDPSVVLAVDTVVFVTFYSRPLQPATYAFAP